MRLLGDSKCQPFLLFMQRRNSLSIWRQAWMFTQGFHMCQMRVLEARNSFRQDKLPTPNGKLVMQPAWVSEVWVLVQIWVWFIAGTCLGFKSTGPSNLSVNFHQPWKLLEVEKSTSDFGWLHYKFPVWGGKFILPERTVTHPKEIHNQSVNCDVEHPEESLGPCKKRQTGSWECPSMPCWQWPVQLWPWGCLPGLIFLDVNTS